MAKRKVVRPRVIIVSDGSSVAYALTDQQVDVFIADREFGDGFPVEVKEEGETADIYVKKLARKEDLHIISSKEMDKIIKKFRKSYGDYNFTEGSGAFDNPDEKDEEKALAEYPAA